MSRSQTSTGHSGSCYGTVTSLRFGPTNTTRARHTGVAHHLSSARCRIRIIDPTRHTKKTSDSHINRQNGMTDQQYPGPTSTTLGFRNGETGHAMTHPNSGHNQFDAPRSNVMNRQNGMTDHQYPGPTSTTLGLHNGETGNAGRAMTHPNSNHNRFVTGAACYDGMNRQHGMTDHDHQYPGPTSTTLGLCNGETGNAGRAMTHPNGGHTRAARLYNLSLGRHNGQTRPNGGHNNIDAARHTGMIRDHCITQEYIYRVTLDTCSISPTSSTLGLHNGQPGMTRNDADHTHGARPTIDTAGYGNTQEDGMTHHSGASSPTSTTLGRHNGQTGRSGMTHPSSGFIEFGPNDAHSTRKTRNRDHHHTTQEGSVTHPSSGFIEFGPNDAHSTRKTRNRDYHHITQEGIMTHPSSGFIEFGPNDAHSTRKTRNRDHHPNSGFIHIGLDGAHATRKTRNPDQHHITQEGSATFGDRYSRYSRYCGHFNMTNGSGKAIASNSPNSINLAFDHHYSQYVGHYDMTNGTGETSNGGRRGHILQKSHTSSWSSKWWSPTLLMVIVVVAFVIKFYITYGPSSSSRSTEFTYHPSSARNAEFTYRPSSTGTECRCPYL